MEVYSWEIHRKTIGKWRLYHLVMTNKLPWKDPPCSVNHLFLRAIYTMATLNNQRVELLVGDKMVEWCRYVWVIFVIYGVIVDWIYGQ
jgi:hypothetical protein